VARAGKPATSVEDDPERTLLWLVGSRVTSGGKPLLG
jgi:hypothetical protein